MAKSLCLGIIAVLLCAVGVEAQTKKKTKKTKKATPTAAATTTATPAPTPVVEATPSKRNERPGGDVKQNAKAPAYVPTHFYEFTRPGFAYSRVLIEHDEAGVGQISFQKDGNAELITDPIRLSAVTLAKINDTLTAMNFLGSTESYQHERDYSHLGNIEIKVQTKAGSRTVRYNWTSNKHAKELMDEYRRISNEWTWRFEITAARENFPLQTPGIMDTLASYLKRSDISDPPTLLPFLTELSSDERLPLMARNNAGKLVKQIEKKKGD